MHWRTLRIVATLAAMSVGSGLTAQVIEGDIPLALQTQGEMDRSADRVQYLQLTSARAAMEFGFSSVAIRILKSVLEDPGSLEPEVRMEARENLMLAHLNQGHVAEAREVFAGIDPETSQAYPFLQLLLLYLDDAPVETIRPVLDQVRDLDPGFYRPWLHLIRGFVLAREGNPARSREELDRALDAAVNAFQRAWIESLIWREEIRRGEASDTLAFSLRSQIQNAVNPIVASQLVQQYAMVQVRLGRQSEAIQTIETQLSILSEEYRAQKDRLLMFLALLSGRDSGRTQVAVEEILLKGETDRIRLMAFYYWLSMINQMEAGRGVSVLENVLATRPNDRLRHEIVYVIAQYDYLSGELESSARAIQRILESDAETELKASAMRVLIAVCWSRNPPQYRLAAQYLQTLQGMVNDPAEQARLSLLVADSYFLNGDFENALPIYQTLLRDGLLADYRDEIVFKLTRCFLRLGNVDGARPYLDEFHRNHPELSELIWGSEWNLTLELVNRGRLEEAIERVQQLKQSIDLSVAEPWKYPASVRAGWLLGFLYFQDGAFQDTLEQTEQTLEEYQTFPAENQENLSVVRDEIRLIDARARFALAEPERAVDRLVQIRENGNAETAASTYLIEARFYWSRGDANQAQRALMRLADLYPTSQYAPVALYEAAMNVESRGTAESDQEAIRLYERISTDFPDHPLNFISTLRQGDLLRKSNQFALAVPFYENMLSEFREDPRSYMIEMALGESYLALGSTRTDYVDQAIRILERILDLQHLPMEVRLEAGTKAASGLLKVNRSFRAQNLLWRVVTMANRQPEASSSLGASGRYWLARAVLMLSERLEQEGELSEVYRLVEMAERMNLPGVNLIRNRL